MGFPIGSIMFMFILAGGMFYGQAQYKKKRAEWGKTLTIACGILIIMTALWTNLCRSNIDFPSIERERLYQRIQAMVLAQQIAPLAKGGAKCLLIHHPVYGDSGKDEVERLVDAFKTGLGDKVYEVRPIAIKNIPVGDDAMAEEAMMEMTAEDFNKVISNNKDCDIVITIVPLPYSEDEIYKMDIFEMLPDADNPSIYVKNPNRKYPIFGIFNGYVGNLEPLFYDGLISAMSLWRPNPTIDELPVPDDIQEAFNKRYLIVTPQNMDAMKQAHPTLFPQPRK